MMTGDYCLLIGFIFIINILILIWVYKDAKKRGSSGALWVIIVLFTGIIGLIIWLVVRPPVRSPVRSPVSSPVSSPIPQQGGTVVINQYQQPPAPTQPVYTYNQPQNSAQTVYKEKEIIKEIIKIKCPYCGALVEQGLDKCPYCGAPLK